MKTVFDLISIILFAGLAILFLQRSASEDPDPVPIWRYPVAAIGCAVGDYVGNNGYGPEAMGVFALTVAFAVFMLKPFDNLPKR